MRHMPPLCAFKATFDDCLGWGETMTIPASPTCALDASLLSRNNYGLAFTCEACCDSLQVRSADFNTQTIVVL